MRSSTAQHVTAPAGTRALSRVLTFFAVAFVLAWGTWIPLFKGYALPKQIAFIGLFAPALAAIVTAAVWDGVHEVRSIARRLTQFNLPFRWCLFSALIMPALYLLGIGALRIFKIGGAGPLFTGSSAAFIAAGFLWLVFVTSGEEIGWRGYALPLLLEHYPRPVLVAVGLGFIWGVWHLPLYLVPGQSAMRLPLFLAFTTLQSVLYTLVFLRTHGSLLPALLLHAGTDIAPRIFQLGQLPSAFWLIVNVILGVIAITLWFAMRRSPTLLSRSHAAIADPIPD